MSMKVSVIMVAYNSQLTIKRSIESFLSQDYKNKELIVVDGASSDGTCRILEEFNSPLIKVHSEVDEGIYDAMNKGLRLMTGECFGFLNSDDCYARKDVLSIVTSALNDIDIVSGGLCFVREHGDYPCVRVWHPERYSAGIYGKGFSVPHPSTYCRYSVFDKVGEFSTRYSSAGDYDWFLRSFELEGFSHGVLPEVLVKMRIGGESTGSLASILNNSKEMLEVRRNRLGVGLIDSALLLNLGKKIRQLFQSE